MAIPRWPAQLPQHVLRSGFSYQFADGRLRTPMDFGPGKVRRRYSSAATIVQAQILVTGDLVARFQRFWNEETSGGAMPFIIPDQLFDGEPLLDGSGNPLLDQSGNPLLVSSYWLARFGDKPSITPDGWLFYVSFQLAVLP